MSRTNSGFELADLDLKTRGPGEFLGTRQAGFATTLKMASITDVSLIEKARTQAQLLFERDPYLQQPEHALLAEDYERFWGAGKGDVSYSFRRWSHSRIVRKKLASRLPDHLTSRLFD